MIRMATLDDVEFIVDNGLTMVEESSYNIYEYNKDKVAVLVDNLIRSEAGFVCIAESDGKRIGWMFGSCVEHWFSSDKIAYEMTTYVLPEYRGGMSGAKMLKKFKEWATTMGAKEIQIGITTSINEERTSLLYKRLGFNPAGGIFKCVPE